MKTARWMCTLLCAGRLFGQYQYFFTDTFPFGGYGQINPIWSGDGSYASVQPSGLTGGQYWGSAVYGAVNSPLLYSGQLPSNGRYEIKSTLPSPATYPTGYVQYVAATYQHPTQLGGSDSYSYYSIGLYPSQSSTSATCNAEIRVLRQEVLDNGDGTWYPQRTYLALANAACPDNTTVRTLFSGSSGQPASIIVFVNDQLVAKVTDSQPLSGAPGVAIDLLYPSSGLQGRISRVDIGPWETVAPNPVSSAGIGTSAFETRVDIQWQPTTDDANGTGIYSYTVLRNGAAIGGAPASGNLTFSDLAPTPGTTYTYAIQATDFHQNVSSQTSFNVTVPAPHINHVIATPPARIGVRPTGAYWGALGEQIDMMSGNLNWTLPLLKAQGRGGSTFAFSLNYNSQMWRLDSGGTWNLGADIGYGFGWRLMAGSISPYWSDPYTIHHYIFIDSTGAEYVLDVNTNGIWTSTEGIYVSYDPAAQKLSFPDGSFWMMTCVSAGNEPDAGTRHPKVMQDWNGNQTLIRYMAGNGLVVPDTSGRILEIEDVRAAFVSGIYRTYLFTYNTDSTPHLIRITNQIGASESYNFVYTGNQSLSSPFSPPVSYGTTTLLQSMTNNAGITHSFEYPGGSAELGRVILPFGGSFRWAYRGFTFAAGRTVREVQYRYLVKQSGGAEQTYWIWPDDATDSNGIVHYFGALFDPTGASKGWYFASTPQWWNGLLFSFIQGNGTVNLRKQDFAWVQDAAGNPYINSAITTLDPGANQQQFKTERTVDSHGNVTQTRIYDFGNLSTPARTYNNAYLADGNYTSRGIWNRLVSSSVTNGSQTVFLVSNGYDAGGVLPMPGQNPPPLRQHDTASYGTNFVYRGNVTSQTTPAGTTTLSRYITGDIQSGTGPGGIFTTTPAASTNFAAPGLVTSNNFQTTLAYSAFLGITSATGQNTDTMTTAYDGAARPAQVVSPHGAVTNFTYGNSSSPIDTETTITNTNGTVTRWVRTTRDGLGRPVKVERGDSSGTKSIVDTEYDSCACSPIGKMKRTSQPYAPGGSVYWTTYTYDNLGRTVSVVAPDGASTTTYSYLGNTTTVTDPAGKWKKYVTDAMGNLIQVIEPNPGNN